MAGESGESGRSLHPGQYLVRRFGSGRSHILFIVIFGRGRVERDNNIGSVYPVRGHALAAGERAFAQPRRVLRTRLQVQRPANAVPLQRIHAASRQPPEALTINHQGQFPSVTVSFNLAPDAALGTAITEIDKLVRQDALAGFLQGDFQGTAASFKNSLSNEALLILAALVTVYIVLGVLYESFIHPITILSTLPSAGVGALLALMLFHQELSVVAIIGIILLIGIVKKNGILIVDFALEAEREHGKESTEAIYEASLLRFRPIMMTTMAALLGGLPLALGRGPRFGVAPSPRHRNGWRPAGQPGPHALHHAGHLHLFRQVWATDHGQEAGEVECKAANPHPRRSRTA